MYIAEFKSNEDIAEAYTDYDKIKKEDILNILNRAKFIWLGMDVVIIMDVPG